MTHLTPLSICINAFVIGSLLFFFLLCACTAAKRTDRATKRDLTRPGK